MFTTLKNALEDCNSAQENGFAHLITDTPYVSGTPLVVYHLLNSLNNGKKVFFLALQNTWSHYCNICSKLGINLRNKTSENSVEVLELMKLLHTTLVKSDIDNPFDFVFTAGVEHTLKELYIHVKNAVERLKTEDSAVTLIIDGITPLLNLGVSDNAVEIFIHYCYNLLEVDKDTLVVSCMQIGQPSCVLTNSLAHKFAILLAVKGLSTGGSKDIHGELSVSRKDNFYLRKQTKFHYKVEDRDVKVFPLGLASKTLS